MSSGGVDDLAAELAECIQHAIPNTVSVTGTLSTWRRGKAWASGEIVTFHPGTTTPLARLSIGVPGRIAAVLERRFDEAGTPLGAGAVVTIEAQPELHPVYGLRLVVKTIQEHQGPDANSITRATLVSQLHAQGWGQHQQQLAWPTGPITLGLISPSGGNAARGDIDAALSPHAEIVVIEKRVPMTGPKATSAISRAIALLGSQVDGLLVVRGGGAAADMLTWDNTSVVKAIATCACPLVLGIGHAQDTPVSELVAHHAAPTPTAAGLWIAAQTISTPIAPQPVPVCTPVVPTRDPIVAVPAAKPESDKWTVDARLVLLLLLAAGTAIVLVLILL